ncbi:alpha/beta hydrolase [Rhizobium sp. FKY42]|uniref:alpha/beta fold hydrolase n=1 Tax=Rhizobium sp. FKY42 TaxID=2562310 RepID=UPI001FEEA6FE|nr:alpha/beta hydrolase [Rhizobium sp. FKY42]
MAYHVYAPNNAVSDALPLVCLAGITRNSRDFRVFAETVASDPIKPRTVICIDYRGRGASDRAEDAATYSILTEAQDCLLVLDTLGITQAIFIGTSRGGLILHILAQLAPERITAAVLNDVGPELGLEGLQLIQSYLSQGNTSTIPDWASAAQQLSRLHGAAFPALEPSDWQDMAHAIYTEHGGKIVPDCDPAIPLAFASIDLEQSLPHLWSQFDLLSDRPMMVVRGEHSTLLTEPIVASMKDRHPKLRVLTAAGQGHAPLLHKPQVRDDLVAFLRTV